MQRSAGSGRQNSCQPNVLPLASRLIRHGCQRSARLHACSRRRRRSCCSLPGACWQAVLPQQQAMRLTWHYRSIRAHVLEALRTFQGHQHRLACVLGALCRSSSSCCSG